MSCLPLENDSSVKMPSSHVLLTSSQGSPSQFTPLLSFELQLNMGSFVVEDKLEVFVVSVVLEGIVMKVEYRR